MGVKSVGVLAGGLVEDLHCLGVGSGGAARHHVGDDQTGEEAGDDLEDAGGGGQTGQQPAQIHHEAGDNASHGTLVVEDVYKRQVLIARGLDLQFAGNLSLP